MAQAFKKLSYINGGKDRLSSTQVMVLNTKDFFHKTHLN